MRYIPLCFNSSMQGQGGMKNFLTTYSCGVTTVAIQMFLTATIPT